MPDPAAAPLTVADRLDIAELACRYAVAVDSRKFEALRRVFAADATLDTGRSVRAGIDEIVGAMEGLHRYEATAHVLGQHLVEVTEAGATGLVYCTAHHLSVRDEQRTDKVMHVRYHDEYVRTRDGWRIATRRLEVPWTDTQTVC